jgi:hypothetical protein
MKIFNFDPTPFREKTVFSKTKLKQAIKFYFNKIDQADKK